MIQGDFYFSVPEVGLSPFRLILMVLHVDKLGSILFPSLHHFHHHFIRIRAEKTYLKKVIIM